MKRHESMVPLSKEHHQSLILAKLLQKGAPAYKGLPVLMEDKAIYALAQFKDHIQAHFCKEEAVFLLLKGQNEEIDYWISKQHNEHEQLSQMFHSLEEHVCLEEKAHELGVLLEQHIRNEERELFQLIQEKCNEFVLSKIKNLTL